MSVKISITELLNEHIQELKEGIDDFEKRMIKNPNPFLGMNIELLKIFLRTYHFLALISGFYEELANKVLTKEEFDDIKTKVVELEKFRKHFDSILEEYKLRKKYFRDSFK